MESNSNGSNLPQHAADIVTLAYHTGIRAGEIFDLTWGWVNMKEGFLVLTKKNTKTEEARHVHLNRPDREILERLGGVRYISHYYVFTYQ